MVEKHPNLRVIFAHFFFIADDLEKAAGYFERFPNMMLDITPGWEMFESFAANYDASRSFFQKYKDRIFYGSDTISDHWRTTVGNLQRVIETEEKIVSFEENCHGLNLDEETMRALYQENYRRFLPAQPNAMNVNEIIGYADRLTERMNREKPEFLPEILQEIQACKEQLSLCKG